MRLVVFDCDGTLVDSQHLIVSAMRTAFRAEGAALPEATAVRRVIGLALDDAIAHLDPSKGDQAISRLVSGYKTAFTVLRQHPESGDHLYPGARQTLLALTEAGHLLGIATGKSRRGLAATLARHGLDKLFVTLQTADDAPGKPNPEMLHRAMDEVGTRPDETVLVGDTVYDMEMARNAGASALGVAWGYHAAAELEAAGAAAILERFDALPRALATLPQPD